MGGFGSPLGLRVIHFAAEIWNWPIREPHLVLDQSEARDFPAKTIGGKFCRAAPTNHAPSRAVAGESRRKQQQLQEKAAGRQQAGRQAGRQQPCKARARTRKHTCGPSLQASRAEIERARLVPCRAAPTIWLRQAAPLPGTRGRCLSNVNKHWAPSLLLSSALVYCFLDLSTAF